MLIRYKKNMEKIAMGLLSFMPEGKDVKRLQQTIKEYAENPDWHLYLWKEDDDVLGAIGLYIDGDINATIQHISVTPSHRNAGIGQKMVHAVMKTYHEKFCICSNELTEQFVTKCEMKKEYDDNY